MRRLVQAVMCSIMAAGLLAAQAPERKPPNKGKATSVLHPEMTVAADAGTYDKPMGMLGDKAGEAWTATTIGAGVDKKPQDGKIMTVTGEVIDMSCYLQLGKHGDKHVACGKKCLTAGQPIGMLAKDGTVYMLMEEEHDPRRDGQTAGFRKAATDHLGHIMEVTGTEATHAGFKAIYVQGFVNKTALIDKDIQQAESRLAYLKERYTDANPDIRSTVAKINSLKAQRDEIAR
jgi:hypothetical protein